MVKRNVPGGDFPNGGAGGDLGSDPSTPRRHLVWRGGVKRFNTVRLIQCSRNTRTISESPLDVSPGAL